MVEMVQLRELTHRLNKQGEEDEEDSRVDDILLYDGLMSLDEELREICENIIEKRIRKFLLNPKRLLLENIQQLLAMGEAAISTKNKNLEVDKPGEPMISPRSKKSPAEIMAEKDKQRIAELEMKLKAVQTNLNLAKEEFIDRRNKRNRLKTQLAQMKADHERDIAELRKRVAEAAEGAWKEQQDLERELKELRESRKKEMEELNTAISKLRRELGEVKQLEAGAKRLIEEREAQLEHLQAKIASKELDSASSESQYKELQSVIKDLKKETLQIQGTIQLNTEKERALREKLTEPRKGPGEIKKKKTKRIKDEGPLVQNEKRGSKSRVIVEDEVEVRGAWLSNLLDVLRAQMLLSTPPDGQSRQWGRPIDSRTIVAPTFDDDLQRIVELLSGSDKDNDTTAFASQDSSHSSASADFTRRLCRGAPSAHSRRPSQNDDLQWLLAPPSAASGGLGQKSRSCTNFNSTSQSWASTAASTSAPRTADSKTVSVRMLDNPPARTFLIRSGPWVQTDTNKPGHLRPQSTASCAGRRPLQTLGFSTCSLCGRGGGTDQCLECQSTVPRLSVGWCLPPLAAEQSAIRGK